ncbi:MAG TPA: [FeFe] hydrogenase H-cluster radical SAM maturase HydE [Elusimicrobiota bacterium]|nr:[FeFe] hydrogenase H-cluster radical SAM maturase HydE [Elusimicrobiota bacterium]
MLTRQEILRALTTSDSGEVEALFLEADRVRREQMGDEVHLRGLIEISNICGRDCLYCGIRHSNPSVRRYRMTPDEVVAAAGRAAALGYPSVVLQSGESDVYSPDEMTELLGRIKSLHRLALTLSLGEKPREVYAAYREAGADRYLLRFETSSESLFNRLKPDSSLRERLECLHVLRELGYQVGSGIMVGLPGQTPDILADDIELLRELDLDMIGIGPFIRNPDTPLAGKESGTLDLTLRVLAILRILTRNTHLPATTAMGSIDPQGREKALQRGANVLMPNVTPTEYREHYRLYPGKICLGDSPETCASCLTTRLATLGRTVAKDPGHSRKVKSGSQPGTTASRGRDR